MPGELPELFPFLKIKQNFKLPPPDKIRRAGGSFKVVLDIKGGAAGASLDHLSSVAVKAGVDFLDPWHGVSTWDIGAF